MVAVLAAAALLHAASLPAEAIAVRHLEGEVHGFLALCTLDGTIIADGDLTQQARGREITNRLVFHFKDGSLQDETAVLSQSGHFRLMTDHLVQKGPAFQHPMDITINGTTGLVTVRYKDDNGRENSAATPMKLPPDLANGIVPILLKNMAPGGAPITVSLLVATPKPQLIKLAISAEGEDSFSTGGASRKATRYVVKVEIGGVRGVLAPLLHKQPPDAHVWILEGSFPAFVKSEAPFFEGGPIWRTELVSPVWQKGATETAERKK